MPDVVNAPITITPNTITAPVTVGAWGKSAYQSYLATTADDPVLSEAAWVASLEGPPGADGAPGPNSVTSSTTSDGTASISVYSVGGEVISAIKSANYSVSMYAADDEAFIGFNINGVIMLVATPLSLTMNREILFPDASGTVALTSDITGTNSGTNTGDETASRIAALIAGTTNKATPEDSDKLGYVTAAGGLVYALWSEIKTWLGTWLDAVATIAGAKTLSGQIQMTGQSATNANSAATVGIMEQTAHRSRDTWVSSVLSGSGTTGVTASRTTTTSAASLDGSIATTAGSGGWLMATLIRSGLFSDFNNSNCVDFRVKWTFFTRCRFQIPTNTELVLGIGYNASAGEPTTGGSANNVGLRIFNNAGTITGRLWKQVAGTVTNSSESTAAPLTSILKTQNNVNSYDVLIWMENLGNGTLNCYMELVQDGSAPAIIRPANPLLTISSLPSGFSTGSGNGTLAFRATGTPGANSVFQVNDSKFFYH